MTDSWCPRERLFTCAASPSSTFLFLHPHPSVWSDEMELFPPLLVTFSLSEHSFSLTSSFRSAAVKTTNKMFFTFRVLALAQVSVLNYGSPVQPKIMYYNEKLSQNKNYFILRDQVIISRMFLILMTYRIFFFFLSRWRKCASIVPKHNRLILFLI